MEGSDDPDAEQNNTEIGVCYLGDGEDEHNLLDSQSNSDGVEVSQKNTIQIFYHQ